MIMDIPEMILVRGKPQYANKNVSQYRVALYESHKEWT
jgi:hypothetical protein